MKDDFTIVEFFKERKARYISTTDDFYDAVAINSEKFWDKNLKFLQILKTNTNVEKSQLKKAVRSASILWDANSRGYCDVNWEKLADLEVTGIYKLLETYIVAIEKFYPHIVKQWDEAVNGLVNENN